MSFRMKRNMITLTIFLLFLNRPILLFSKQKKFCFCNHIDFNSKRNRKTSLFVMIFVFTLIFFYHGL